MSAQSYTTAPSPPGRQLPAKGMNKAIISRATLQTRPGIQRLLIRSWDYNCAAVRIASLIVRLLVVLWLVVLGAALMSAGHTWGWILLPSAVAVLALSLWVYTTAVKGWPRR